MEIRYSPEEVADFDAIYRMRRNDVDAAIAIARGAVDGGRWDHVLAHRLRKMMDSNSAAQSEYRKRLAVVLAGLAA